MSKKNGSFFTYYDLGLKRKRWNCVTLSQELQDRGVKISPRSLQRYRTGEMVPRFDNAKHIFQVLDIDATDDQIRKSLIVAGGEKDEWKDDDGYLRKGIHIKLDKLSSNKNEDNASIMLRLEQRMKETQRYDRRNFNHYVQDLIKYDLDHHILPDYSDDESAKGDK